MARPEKIHSHPICPTCQSDLTGREDLAYFVSEPGAPIANDDVYHLFEETSRLMYFLGALAQAGSLAAAQHAEKVKGAPDWLEDFVELAQELTKETERRLSLLDTAGRIWRDRANR